MIVKTDLSRETLVHSKEVKKWLAEYKHLIEDVYLLPENMPAAEKRKIRNIQIVINTIDDTKNKPF